ncbi:unnamed protein product [Adineta ricciae]|uniref:Uncharacterized protein n=2 Tax=Adineta ricciae TaxID=249248 RepID=A0A815UKQ1_ADIRI|nr:unnamed protein product [Adineta ricciae]
MNLLTAPGGSVREQQILTRLYLDFYLASPGIVMFYTVIVECSTIQTFSVSSVMDDASCLLRVNAFDETYTTNTVHIMLMRSNLI